MKLTANPALGFFHVWVGSSGAKLVRVMKLTTIIILAACLQSSANGLAQNTVTFTGKDVNLEMVFTAIKKQTSYRFFFNTSIIQNASKITIEVKNAPIEQVMNLALKDQSLTFAIKGRTIFVMKKPEEEKQSSQVMRLQGDPVTVSGRVTDEQGNPLVGANVKVKGSDVGTTTDNQGRFTLSNVEGNGMLEISFVGHETQVLSVKGKTSFVVALGQKVGALDETVVIAYGTTTRRFSTGNVSSVKASEIEKQPVNNPLLALEGRVPGLFIQQSNGLPGSGVTVRIQGRNSILAGNDPLYIIDGVPYPSQMLATTTGGSMLGSSGASVTYAKAGQGNPLSYINPNDIESVEILKDADATSIYGSRAANGAILITTKKGKAGLTRTDINIQNGWGKVTKAVPLMHTEQYIEMRKQALQNDNLVPNVNSDFDLTLWDTTKYTDWVKTLIGGTAKYLNANASVSGGTSNLQYLVGASFQRQTAVFPGDFSDRRGDVHFNINSISTNQKLHIQLSGTYLSDNNQLPKSDPVGLAYTLAPNAPDLYNSDGTLNWAPNTKGNGNSSWTNPLAYLNTLYENKTDNLLASGLLGYKLLNGLEVSSRFGYNKLETNEYAPTFLMASKPESRPTSSRATNYSSSNIKTWLMEPQISYKRILGRGSLDLLLGFTIQQTNNNGESLTGSGFVTDALTRDIRSASSFSITSTLQSVYKYNAAFGRINYSWMEKYILNFNVRRDGTSRFGSQNRFHNFGSIGGAWIFSQESFLKDLKFLSFGKIKGSYGTTGNDQVGDYIFMELYNSNNQPVAYQGTSGLIASAISNPYLQWEETKKTSVGVELGFFNDRILFSGSYSRNQSSNQLLSYALPIIAGFGSVNKNFPATIRNTSLELTVNTINIKSRNLTWSSSVNLTIPKNKLVSFPDVETSSYANTYVVGQPVSIIKAYHFAGVNQTTGQYEFNDVKGNVTNNPSFLTDRLILINTNPKFYGGVQNSISIKGFRLDFLFQFVKQIGQLPFAFGSPNSPPGSSNTNQPSILTNVWQRNGDIANFQRYNSDFTYYNQWSAANSSDAAYQDASFIRLKNISLSYELPENWKQKIHTKSFRLYALGQNLVTITNFYGVDPESQSGAALPPLKIWTLGIQLGF